MKIKMTVNLNNAQYRYILSLLYTDRKRITDLRDHATAHGAFVDAPTEALDGLIAGLEYGELLEGSRE